MPTTVVQVTNTKRLKETLNFSTPQKERVVEEQLALITAESKKWLKKSNVAEAVFREHLDQIESTDNNGSLKENLLLKIASNKAEAMALAWHFMGYSSYEGSGVLSTTEAYTLPLEGTKVVSGGQKRRFSRSLSDLYQMGAGFLSENLPLDEIGLIFKAGFPYVRSSATESLRNRPTWGFKECEYLFSVASEYLPNFKRVQGFRTTLTSAVIRGFNRGKAELPMEYVELFRDYNTLGQIPYVNFKPAVMEKYSLRDNRPADVYMNSAVLGRKWDCPLIDIDSVFAADKPVDFRSILAVYKASLHADELALLDIAAAFVEEALEVDADPVVPFNMPVYGFGSILIYLAHIENLVALGEALPERVRHTVSIYFEELENCIPSWLIPAMMVVDSPVEDYVRYNTAWISPEQLSRNILLPVLESNRFKSKIEKLVLLQEKATTEEEERILLRLRRLQNLFHLQSKDRQWEADAATVEAFVGYEALIGSEYFGVDELLNFGLAKFAQENELNDMPDSWVLKMVENLYGFVAK